MRWEGVGGRTKGQSRVLRHPRAFTGKIQLDHLTLIPASQLPFKEHWNQIASGLPAREVMIVVPHDRATIRDAFRSVARQLQAQGRHITVMSPR